MKHKVISVIYLLTVVFYLVRPSLPYIEYALCKDYISKYLCVSKDIPDNSCHGKCFLEKELKKTLEPVDAERNNNKKVLQDRKVEDHLISGGVFTKLFEQNINQSICYTVKIYESVLPAVFVPPRLQAIK